MKDGKISETNSFHVNKTEKNYSNHGFYIRPVSLSGTYSFIDDKLQELIKHD